MTLLEALLGAPYQVLYRQDPLTDMIFLGYRDATALVAFYVEEGVPNQVCLGRQNLRHMDVFLYPPWIREEVLAGEANYSIDWATLLGLPVESIQDTLGNPEGCLERPN